MNIADCAYLVGRYCPNAAVMHKSGFQSELMVSRKSGSLDLVGVRTGRLCVWASLCTGEGDNFWLRPACATGCVTTPTNVKSALRRRRQTRQIRQSRMVHLGTCAISYRFSSAALMTRSREVAAHAGVPMNTTLCAPEPMEAVESARNLAWLSALLCATNEARSAKDDTCSHATQPNPNQTA